MVFISLLYCIFTVFFTFYLVFLLFDLSVNTAINVCLSLKPMFLKRHACFVISCYINKLWFDCCNLLALFGNEHLKSLKNNFFWTELSLSYLTSSSLHRSVQWCLRTGRTLAPMWSPSSPSSRPLSRCRPWTWRPTLWRTWRAGCPGSERPRRTLTHGSVRREGQLHLVGNVAILQTLHF